MVGGMRPTPHQNPSARATEAFDGGARRLPVIAAAILDTVLILTFAALGRDAHHRGDVVTGVLLTAWPFLAGAALGWLAQRAWHSPWALRSAGLGIWGAAVIGGMLLRLATGQSVALAFIIVTMIVLGLFILGPRAIHALVRRRRRSAETFS